MTKPFVGTGAGESRPRILTPREPLYTLTEIADRLDMPVVKLRGLMGGHARVVRPGAPRPSAQHWPKRSYYRLSDFRRWMATFTTH